MLTSLRHQIITQLWQIYRQNTPQIQQIESFLQSEHSPPLTLDHFAIIDLPGPYSGIPILKQLFSLLGYTQQGQDYLPQKQNDFLWLAETDCAHQEARTVLPQAVVADFRLDEMPPAIRDIILRYARQTQPLPLTQLKLLSQAVHKGSASSAESLARLILHYLKGRDWALPTVNEFHTVQEFNELLAWVLIFGRRPNHFTLSIHLLDKFDSLAEFHRLVEYPLQLPLNHEGGTIKGSEAIGIEQGSTIGTTQTVTLADGTVSLPTGFVEFVWRFPSQGTQGTPTLWRDFFTGFVANHANHVIESLYAQD